MGTPPAVLVRRYKARDGELPEGRDDFNIAPGFLFSAALCVGSCVSALLFAPARGLILLPGRAPDHPYSR